jgi:hypothetical protein
LGGNAFGLVPNGKRHWTPCVERYCTSRRSAQSIHFGHSCSVFRPGITEFFRVLELERRRINEWICPPAILGGAAAWTTTKKTKKPKSPEHAIMSSRQVHFVRQQQNHPAAIGVAKRPSSDLKLTLHWQLLLADCVWQECDGQVEFYPAEPLETIRVQQSSFAHLQCAPIHDAVSSITNALNTRVWQDRDDDPFAEHQPDLSELHRRCTEDTLAGDTTGQTHTSPPSNRLDR